MAEVEEGEEEEELLLSVLSILLVKGVPALLPHPATITPGTIATSIYSHQ